MTSTKSIISATLRLCDKNLLYAIESKIGYWQHSKISALLTVSAEKWYNSQNISSKKGIYDGKEG